MALKYHPVRVTPTKGREDQKDVLRVHLSHNTLSDYKLKPQDVVNLVTEDGRHCPGIAWSGKFHDDTVQISKGFQDIHKFKASEKVTIRVRGAIKPAESIEIVPTSVDPEPIFAERKVWIWHMNAELYSAQLLSIGMVFEAKGEPRREFRISSIDGTNSPDVYHSVHTTKVEIVTDTEHQGSKTRRNLCINNDKIGGLDCQIKKLNSRLLLCDKSMPKFQHPIIKKLGYGGVLLHGSSGVGKTMLLNRVLSAEWTKSFLINAGKTSPREIQKVFAEAICTQPSVIAIDNLERLSSEELPVTEIVDALDEGFDEVKNRNIVVIGATSALRDIQKVLRRAGAFSLAIHLPMPDRVAREQILKAVSAPDTSTSHKALEDLADRTAGFAGGDLVRLVHEATTKAYYREIEGSFKDMLSQGFKQAACSNDTVCVPTREDYDHARLEVGPASMSDFHLETPKVRWDDIGGGQALKNLFRQVLEWPKLYPEAMERLGIAPVKGILLYGPPGCSKTLTARAIATETGLNFIAVKGGEFFNMYLGESERMLRQIFQKAREASPSIIFFDEVDALGGRRESRPSASNSLQVLTTLLNELDGIEELTGVLVLAATNKPEILDPALTRPGRIDELIYVDLPDKPSRAEILSLNIQVTASDAGNSNIIEWVAGCTDGYSGAELIKICEKAKRLAMQQAIHDGSLSDKQLDISHFEQALRETEKRTTQEMLDTYVTWSRGGA